MSSVEGYTWRFWPINIAHKRLKELSVKRREKERGMTSSSFTIQLQLTHTHTHTHTHTGRPLCRAGTLLPFCIHFMLIIGLNSTHMGSVVLGTLTSVSRSPPVIKGVSSVCQLLSVSHCLLVTMGWSGVNMLLLLNWSVLMSLIPSWKTLFGDAPSPERGPKTAVVSCVCVCVCVYVSAALKRRVVKGLLWVVGVVLNARLRRTMCEVKIVQ